MIWITKELDVYKISFFKFLFTTIVLWFITKLFQFESNTMSTIISIASSLCIAFYFNKSRLLEGQNIKHIFESFATSNTQMVNEYNEAFYKQFSKEIVIVNLYDKSSIKDLSFLFSVFNLTFEDNCSKTNFRKMFEYVAETDIKKTLFVKYDFDYKKLYLTFFLNYKYADKYLCNIEKFENIQNNILKDEDYLLLFDFANKCIFDIKNHLVESFRIISKEYLRIISNKDLLTIQNVTNIISQYLNLLMKIPDNLNFVILKEMIILQLSNCVHSIKCIDANVDGKNRLEKLVISYGYENEKHFINFLEKYFITNEVIRVLIGSIKDDFTNLKIVTDRIRKNKKINYPSILDIAILNHLNHSFSISRHDFIKCYEYYMVFFKEIRLSNYIFRGYYNIYESLYQYFINESNYRNIVEKLLNSIISSKDDSEIYYSVIYSIYISVYSNDEMLINELYNKYVIQNKTITEQEFDSLLYQVDEANRVIQLPQRYGRSLKAINRILDYAFVPHISNNTFFKLLEKKGEKYVLHEC